MDDGGGALVMAQLDHQRTAREQVLRELLHHQGAQYEGAVGASVEREARLEVWRRRA
jgi:G:T-mismatch repair DNA endonuclease (very short patch repair protein)